MYCAIHPLSAHPTHSNANVSIALLVARAPYITPNRHTRSILHPFFHSATTCPFRFRDLTSRYLPQSNLSEANDRPFVIVIRYILSRHTRVRLDVRN